MKLTDELFERIIGCASPHLEKGPGAERRENGRVRLPARIHVIPMSNNVAGKPILSLVRDLSLSGIGLLLPQKLELGDRILVRLTSKKGAIWIFCQVRRVERVAAGLFVTGATYDRIVSPEKLEVVEKAA